MARPRTGFPRKDKSWTGFLFSTLNLTADSMNLAGSLAANETQTIMRMIGEYLISPTTAPAADDAVVITVAFGIVSTDAFAAGAASVPDPAAEPEYPWLYWAEHPLSFDLSAAFTSVAGAVRHTYDIRSMRKLRRGQSLARIVQYSNVGGNPPISVHLGGTRVLIAE